MREHHIVFLSALKCIRSSVPRIIPTLWAGDSHNSCTEFETQKVKELDQGSVEVSRESEFELRGFPGTSLIHMQVSLRLSATVLGAILDEYQDDVFVRSFVRSKETPSSAFSSILHPMSQEMAFSCSLFQNTDYGTSWAYPRLIPAQATA